MNHNCKLSTEQRRCNFVTGRNGMPEGNVFNRVCLSTGGARRPQVTTACDGIGKSQVTWHPLPPDIFKVVHLRDPLSTWGHPPPPHKKNMLKLVHLGTTPGPVPTCLLCRPYIYRQEGSWPSTERPCFSYIQLKWQCFKEHGTVLF